MQDLSKYFNALTYRDRIKVGLAMNGAQINQLKREKARLKSNYDKSVKEINEQIKNITKCADKNVSMIAKWDREESDSSTNKEG